MSCLFPLKAFYKEFEPGVVFCSSVDDWNRGSFVYKGHLLSRKVEVPCGQCRGCRLEYSRQWAVRCVLESLSWKNNLWLTLTYDDEHLPCSEHPVFDDSSGEVFGSEIVHPLCFDDLQTFMKDLREYIRYHFNHTGVRFFAAGEYGDLSMRPHFHVCLFNVLLDDLKVSGKNFRGDLYYKSETISKIWDKGLYELTDLNFDNAAYTARYMMKKHKGLDRDWYSDRGLVPEGTRMSNRPGIARSFFDAHSGQIYKFDELCFAGADGKAVRTTPPRYFDRLYEVDHPDHLASIKEVRRENAVLKRKAALSQTDLSDDVYLAKKAVSFEKRLLKLPRHLSI